jgi:dolichyl-phosphate-mannose-protein mannosyltransferase
MHPAASTGTGRPRHLVVVLVGLVLMRWWLGTTPGYPPDLGAYKHWALWGAFHGVTTIYDETSFYDYPPLYAYMLSPLGSLVVLVDRDYAVRYMDPDLTKRPGYSALFSLLIKLPPLAFDVLMALLLAKLAFAGGMWPPGRARRGWSPALLYLWLPSVLFISGYWGQPDIIETFFLMLAMALMLRDKPEAGWVAAALALLMKPLAAPFLPLLAWLTLLRSGWRRLLAGGLAAALTMVAVLLPFIIAGRGALVFRRLFTDVDLMSYTSVNAHNLWWILGPWKPASASWWGPLTPSMIGLGLFGCVYVALLWWVWRRERGSREMAAGGAHWYLAAAAVPFAFFTFSTHMHENHLFPALPFLVLLAGRDRRWAYVLAAVGLVTLVNMFTHDIRTGMTWLANLGPPSGFYHPDINRFLSRSEMTIATGNSVLTVATFVVFFYWVLRDRGDAVTPAPDQGSLPSSAR